VGCVGCVGFVPCGVGVGVPAFPQLHLPARRNTRSELLCSVGDWGTRLETKTGDWRLGELSEREGAHLAELAGAAAMTRRKK